MKPIDLPEQFLKNMQTLLKEDYSAYLQAMEASAVSGMRINPIKADDQNIASIKAELNVIKQVPYTDNGYIITSSKIGKHPYHMAGAVYVQEPSSMLAVAASELEKQEDKDALRILDLCAAPGGKTGQIAEILDGKGVLVSNEIERPRAKILQSNVERMGYSNVIITNASPEQLSKKLSGLFDYIFVDAPCGGEGMFRKDPDTIKEWKAERIESNSERQKQILTFANDMLKPNGKLVYSTCTFNKAENEDVVEWFSDNFNYQFVLPNVKIIEATTFLSNPACRRFYPHTCGGEGQFVCVLKKGEVDVNLSQNKKLAKLGKQEITLTSEFLDDFNLPFAINLTKVGENICLINQNLQNMLEYMQFLPVINAGITLGNITKGRFVPHNNSFTALGKYCKNKIHFGLKDDNLYKYLHGEQLQNQSNLAKGYGVVTVNNISVGGVKISGNSLKNLLPKGLRI